MDTVWKTRALCIAVLGIVIFATSCESKLDLLPRKTPATAKLPKCSFNNVDYKVGETWNPFLLPEGYYRCTKCSCELSSDGSRAIINCRGCKTPSEHAKPSLNEQQNSCIHKGTQRIHGTVWATPARDQNVLDANQCKECSCTDGYVTCAIRNCPVLSCANQTSTDGTCCPVCAGHVQGKPNPIGCQTMGRSYVHLETWHPIMPPRYDKCITCTCQNTSIECRKQECPKLPCKNPQRNPGNCCDSCPARKLPPRIPALFRILTEKKADPNPGECIWPGKGLRFPHNATFNPTVEPFGVVPCIRCFCNPANSQIDCEHLKCPASYPCQNPVSVPGQCCKRCEGPDTPVKNSSNGVSICSIGKHWRVYNYTLKPQDQMPEIKFWEQFALEDKDSVEIHTLYGNKTTKVVKVSNAAKSKFHQILKNNSGYKYIGKIREVQKKKIKTWEQRACNPTKGCIHTVGKIMKGLRERVTRCKHHTTLSPLSPDQLLRPE